MNQQYAVCKKFISDTIQQEVSLVARGRESACQRDAGSQALTWKDLLRRNPTPVLLLGKCQGWRSLAGHIPWGRKRARHYLGTKLQYRMWKIKAQERYTTTR